MNGSFLILNITSDEVKLIEIGQENGDRTVRRWEYFSIQNGNQPAAFDTIKGLLQKSPPKTLKTYLVLSSQDLDYIESSFPFDSHKKVSRALSFELSSDYPPEEYIIDYIESISREPGQKTFLAAIARKKMLRNLIEESENAGLEVVGITSDLSTLGSYFYEESEALIMNSGEHGTLFALYSYGVPLLVRDIPIGLKDLENCTTGGENQQLRSLMAEIKRTVHSFSDKSGLDLRHIHISGGLYRHKEILESIPSGLEIGFISEVPCNNDLQQKGIERDHLNLYAVLLGIIHWKRKPKIFNFLKDEFFKEDPKALQNRFFRWVAALVLFFLLAMISSSWLRVSVLEKRNDFLTSEIRSVFAAAFPTANRTGNEVPRAMNFLDALKTDKGEDLRSTDQSILDVLLEMSSAIPERITFQISSLFWEKGKVELKGKTDSFKNVNLIQEALAGVKLFSAVTVSNATSKNEGQDVEFNIAIRLVE